MLEKLNILSIKKTQKLNTFELELFIELLENHINWDQVLEIMKLENDDELILNKIDVKTKLINQNCKNSIPRIYRIDWLTKRTINKRIIDRIIKKAFIYPVFLWLLSLNLITFLVLYILPSTIETFSSFSNTINSLKILMFIIQFIIGLEWGILLLIVYLFYTTKKDNLTRYYLKLYQFNKRNLFVYLVSYLYLFDFLSLLNLDLTLESLFTILKKIDYPLYFEISDIVLSNLKQGKSLKLSFEYLDLTFLKIIAIDDYERKISMRLQQYLNVLKKQIEIAIQKYANIFVSIVYIQIGLMVFVVYSILLYPLKLLEGMNL